MGSKIKLNQIKLNNRIFYDFKLTWGALYGSIFYNPLIIYGVNYQ